MVGHHRLPLCHSSDLLCGHLRFDDLDREHDRLGGRQVAIDDRRLGGGLVERHPGAGRHGDDVEPVVANCSLSSGIVDAARESLEDTAQALVVDGHCRFDLLAADLGDQPQRTPRPGGHGGNGRGGVKRKADLRGVDGLRLLTPRKNSTSCASSASSSDSCWVACCVHPADGEPRHVGTARDVITHDEQGANVGHRQSHDADGSREDDQSEPLSATRSPAARVRASSAEQRSFDK